MRLKLRFQSNLPILLSILFTVSITTLVHFSVNRWTGWNKITALTLITCYLGWLAIESRIAIKETGRSETLIDSGTLEIYAFGRAATVITALVVPIFWPEQGIGRISYGILGTVIFFVGVSFRLWAIHTLGRFYSHRVRLLAEHSLIEDGPYQWIRHPAYTGMLLAHVGFVLFFFNWAALAVLLVVFLPAVVGRILIEEKALFPDVPGYAEYAFKRKRLLPLIW